MRCRRVCWVCLLRTDVVKNLCALRVQLQPGLCNDGSLLLLLHPPLASGLHHLESRVQEKERRRPACAYQNAAVAQVPGKSAGCGPSTPPGSAVYPGTVICGTFVRKGCVAFRRGRLPIRVSSRAQRVSELRGLSGETNLVALGLTQNRVSASTKRDLPLRHSWTPTAASTRTTARKTTSLVAMPSPLPSISMTLATKMPSSTTSRATPTRTRISEEVRHPSISIVL